MGEPVDSRPVDKLIPPKESVRPLWYSSRVMQADELLRLSKNIGSGWKSVGNGLKFNWAQLEQFEADTRCQGEAIHRMLYRWLQWGPKGHSGEVDEGALQPQRV